MEIDEAIAIIAFLADGKDPVSGETLPPSSVYQQADTVRALFLALEGLERLKHTKDRAAAAPPKAGRPWTPEEDKELLRKFDAAMDVVEIAELHQRSKGAIWSRLGKHGRVQPKDYNTAAPRLTRPTPEPAPRVEPAQEDEEEYPF